MDRACRMNVLIWEYIKDFGGKARKNETLMWEDNTKVYL
jgi:hypothetical protein